MIRAIMRCLIVDDSEAFLASAAGLLESQGIQIVGCASSTKAALRMAAELTPELALVDIELGTEDGIELARELLAAATTTQVVLISAYDWEDLPELIDDTRIQFLPKTSLSAMAIQNALGSASA
jgi:two-component system, response regulator PdtaR